MFYVYYKYFNEYNSPIDEEGSRPIISFYYFRVWANKNEYLTAFYRQA